MDWAEPSWVEIDGLRLRYVDLPGPAERADHGGRADRGEPAMPGQELSPPASPDPGQLSSSDPGQLSSSDPGQLSSSDPGPPPPPVLVIPGHTARIEGFADLAPLLAAERRVLVLDLPGSGESDKPVRRYDLRFYEDALVAFLDHLGIDQAVPVGGSLGGNLVLRLGHRFPERFPRLVLWAPGSAWKAKPVLAALTDRLMGKRMFWPVVKAQSRFWYADDYPDRQRELDDTFAYYRRVMSPGFVAMYWGMAADQLRHSLFDIAPQITQPTLLMWGDQDNGAAMGKGVARLHRLIPDNRLHVFPGRRHSLEAECPHDLAAAILTAL